MRNDMYDLIRQRTRPAGRISRKCRPPRDIEDQPFKEPLRHPLHGLHRHSLRPLRRYLDQQVGRPWDEIYSELRRPLNRERAPHREIERCLPDLVAIGLVHRDGALHAICSWYGLRPLAEIRQRLYVDPDNGRLMRNQAAMDAHLRWRRERNRQLAEQRAGWKENVRSLDAGTQLHRIDGIWYQVRLTRVPSPLPRPTAGARPRTLERRLAFDVLLRKPVERCNGARCGRYGRCDLYACAKRQLSHRELAWHRLKNDTSPDAYDPSFGRHSWRCGSKYRGSIRPGGRHKEH